ncbi:MAG: hypothetical protein GF405_01015 [Candidatus Eisenbacteria bacterium]|nr:hypothetical protein [Candidatus Eisenbacteria bacterium]
MDNTTLTGMKMMGTDATTIGDWDLWRGVTYLKRRIADSGLTFVSANVIESSTGELLVDPYVVIERGGLRFAITGVIQPNDRFRTHRDVDEVGVEFADPYESLKELLPTMRTESDFVILLAHTGFVNAEELVGRLGGVDFLVLGRHGQHVGNVREFHGAIFMEPGTKGQYLTDLRATFDDEGILTGYSGGTLTLGDKVPADASMALFVKEHKQAVEKLQKERLAAQADRRAEEQQTAQYTEDCIGVAESCERCHTDEYEQWKTTAHAHAYDTLESSHQATNPECLRCHVTCRMDLAQDGSEQVPDELRNVQCEACHGMGTEHARDGSYGQVTVATCLECHDEENSPDFDFATYLPKVTH